jgi:APA family basic amino acid/polyamine antiporter
VKNEKHQHDTEPIWNGGLLPRLGLMTAIMVIMGNMIGSGVFKKAAPMSASVQSAGLMLLCWLIAGIISLFGALSNAEVSGLIAGPGGFYAFFKKMYGRAFAFLFCWSSFSVLQSASIASIAYVFGQSANTLLGLPRLSASWESISIFGVFFPFENFGVKVFTICTLLCVTMANYFGVIFGGIIANISTMLKLLGIGVLIVLGLAAGNGSMDNILPLGPASGAEYGDLGLFGAMFAALLGAFWAYDGWNNAISLGGEVRNPKRNIPLALVIGVAGVVGVYMLVNFAYAYVMPVDEMKALAASDNSIIGVEVMRKAFGNGAAQFVAILILLSTFGAMNCQLMTPSRMYFTMANDGLFFKAAAKCHPKYHTPSTALLMQGCWASFLVLTGTFDQLTDTVIFASFIFYGASAFGVFVLRRSMRDAHRPYRVHGYPFVPAIFVLFCFALVIVTIIQQPREAIIGLVLIFTGWPFYFYWTRRRPEA